MAVRKYDAIGNADNLRDFKKRKLNEQEAKKKKKFELSISPIWEQVVAFINKDISETIAMDPQGDLRFEYDLDDLKSRIDINAELMEMKKKALKEADSDDEDEINEIKERDELPDKTWDEAWDEVVDNFERLDFEVVLNKILGTLTIETDNPESEEDSANVEDEDDVC